MTRQQIKERALARAVEVARERHIRIERQRVERLEREWLDRVLYAPLALYLKDH